MPTARWTLEVIKQGIDKFVDEYERYPTAWDYDKTPYLPSARQIQRAFGGLEKLRIQLGYEDINYTKGLLRRHYSTGGTQERN